MTDGTTAAGYTNPDLLEVGPLPEEHGVRSMGSLGRGVALLWG